MTGNTIFQVICAGVFIVASFFLANPIGMWMPDDVHMLTLAGVVIAAGFFAAFVLSEGRGDEREDSHRAFAGRSAFFAGSLVLVIAITVQTLNHSLDPWLLVALAAMITAKVAARLYATRYR